jgi:hypothetical protein
MTRSRFWLARIVFGVAAAAAGLVGVAAVAGPQSASAAGATGVVARADSASVVSGAGDDGVTTAELQRAARGAHHRSGEIPGRPMAWFGIVSVLGILVGIPIWLLRDRR